MRILLAEDDPHVSVIMQLCLERLGGHTVTVCADGESAFQTATQNAFDLILLDGMMPKKSGLQVARDLRSTAGYTTPIIFLSAKSDDVSGFLALGHGYIPKPFDPQTICSRITEIMNQKGAAVG